MGQVKYKCNTVLERGQVAHEDPTIKNPDISSQESGTSFMSPKGHILTWGTLNGASELQFSTENQIHITLELLVTNINFVCFFVC